MYVERITKVRFNPGELDTLKFLVATVNRECGSMDNCTGCVFHEMCPRGFHEDDDEPTFGNQLELLVELGKEA